MKTQVYLALIGTVAAAAKTDAETCAKAGDDCTFAMCDDAANKKEDPFTKWKGCESDLFVCNGVSTTDKTDAKCSWATCNADKKAADLTTYKFCADFVGDDNDCRLNDKSCTADICKDHQVADGDKKGDWKMCTYTWTRTEQLSDAKTEADWKSLQSGNAKDLTDATTAHTTAAAAVTDSEKAKGKCDKADLKKDKVACDALTATATAKEADVTKFTDYKTEDGKALDAYNKDRVMTVSKPVDATTEADTTHNPAVWAKWESGSLKGAEQDLTAVHAIAHTNSSDEASNLTKWTDAHNTWNNDGTKAVAKTDKKKAVDATWKCDDAKLTAAQKDAKDNCVKFNTDREDAAADYHQSRANVIQDLTYINKNAKVLSEAAIKKATTDDETKALLKVAEGYHADAVTASTAATLAVTDSEKAKGKCDKADATKDKTVCDGLKTDETHFTTLEATWATQVADIKKSLKNEIAHPATSDSKAKKADDAAKDALTKDKDALAADSAALTKAKCSLAANMASTECVALAAKDAKAAATVKAQEIVVKVDSSSGSTVGIIIGCVVGVLCIGGGAAWYIKHQKHEDFADDLYTPMVADQEM